MKTKLILLFFLNGMLSFAQAPINNYFSEPNSTYAIVTGTIDQSPIGANVTWNFGTLAQSGTNTDIFDVPTAAELIEYPGTTEVLTITDNAMSTNQALYKVTGSELSLTGASNAEFTLNYSTNNALVGNYPLTFSGPTINDVTAGQLMAQGQTPNFTGTIDTEVDAYGTLNFDVTGLGTYSGNVTRIRTEQNIAFTVVIFPGTATIVNYNYYKDSDGTLVFRTTDGVISVPGAGINDVFSLSDALITNTLSIKDDVLALKTVKVYPNPVENVLNITTNDNFTIESVKIMDLNGRTVLTSNENNRSINTSQLRTGFYITTITTENGSVTKKFIKK